MLDVQDAVAQGTLWESLATKSHLGLTHVPVASESFPESDGGMRPFVDQRPSASQCPDPRRTQWVQTVWVNTPEGLHLRRCAAIAELVGNYQARVTLQKGDQSEDAASVLGLMLLAMYWRASQVGIPWFVRIKPKTLGRLVIYAQREAYRTPIFLVSAGLPEPLTQPVTEGFEAVGIKIHRWIEVDGAEFETATNLLAELPGDCDALFGLGGGKCLDVAKYAASLAAIHSRLLGASKASRSPRPISRSIRPVAKRPLRASIQRARRSGSELVSLACSDLMMKPR